jgi:2,3-dihydroxybenzoate-AMP ligase
VRVPRPRADRYRHDGLWQNERVDELVMAQARIRPGETALVQGDRRLTHGALAELIRSAANRLHDNGIARGDLVLVQLPNTIELVVLTLALARLGAVAVMTPMSLRHREMDHIIRTTEAVAIAVPLRYRRFDHFRLAAKLRTEHPALKTIFIAGGDAPDTVDLDALCALPVDPRAALDVDRGQTEDMAVCLLSSGTTGPPKVAPRLHEPYGYQLRRSAQTAGVGPGSVYLAVMPATHGFVLGCPGVLGTLAAGGRVVLGSSTEPEVAFELIEREQVTHCALVPALMQQWVEAARRIRYTPSSLQVLQVGGARPQRTHLELVLKLLECRVQQCYGMSEGLLCYTDLEDTLEVMLDTQGRPMSPADEVCVVDDVGEPVRPGDIGELLTRGPYTIAGYYQSSEANAEAFTTDGYYRTGDLVYRHPSGSLVVVGRTRDVINRGGEKIPAAEIDLMVAEIPGVRAAAAVAASHHRWGEVICVFVVPEVGQAPELSEIRRSLRERGLAQFKLPERLEIVDKLPYIGIGKVDKKQLRAWAAAQPSS